MGAMTFPKQVEIVEDHINDAKARGAQILIGAAATRTSRDATSSRRYSRRSTIR